MKLAVGIIASCGDKILFLERANERMNDFDYCASCSLYSFAHASIAPAIAHAPFHLRVDAASLCVVVPFLSSFSISCTCISIPCYMHGPLCSSLVCLSSFHPSSFMCLVCELFQLPSIVSFVNRFFVLQPTYEFSFLHTCYRDSLESFCLCVPCSPSFLLESFTYGKAMLVRMLVRMRIVHCYRIADWTINRG